MLYVDDAILVSKINKRIDAEIGSLKSPFDLTDKVPLKYYLGTPFDCNYDASIELTHPRMIQRALKVVGLDVNDQHVKMHNSPASSEKLLDNDPNGKPRLQPWHYRSAVGCLSYISAMIHPDITMPVQQCARFCKDTRKEHGEAVKRICRYLLRVHGKGLILKPDRTRGLECWVDAYWSGSCQHRLSHEPPICPFLYGLRHYVCRVSYYMENLPCKNWLHC